MEESSAVEEVKAEGEVVAEEEVEYVGNDELVMYFKVIGCTELKWAPFNSRVLLPPSLSVCSSCSLSRCMICNCLGSGLLTCRRLLAAGRRPSRCRRGQSHQGIGGEGESERVREC